METIILSGCAIIENNKLLLLWKKNRQHYEFPGGKLKDGENIEEGAIREAKEEIGCEVNLIKYIGYHYFEYNDKLYQSHKFIAVIQDGNGPCLAEPEVFDHYIRMPIKDYLGYVLAPNVKYFCSNYIQGNYF